MSSPIERTSRADLNGAVHLVLLPGQRVSSTPVYPQVKPSRRTGRGYSWAELAERADVSIPTLRHWVLAGYLRPIRAEKIHRPRSLVTDAVPGDLPTAVVVTPAGTAAIASPGVIPTAEGSADSAEVRTSERTAIPAANPGAANLAVNPRVDPAAARTAHLGADSSADSSADIAADFTADPAVNSGAPHGAEIPIDSTAAFALDSITHSTADLTATRTTPDPVAADFTAVDVVRLAALARLVRSGVPLARAADLVRDSG